MAGETPLNCDREVTGKSMIKSVGVFALVLLGSVYAVARKPETLQEVVARADSAKADQQPKLYMDAAELQHKAATDALKANRRDDFHTDLDDIVRYCDKAHAAAIQSKKHVKDTEIRIRRISSHLKEMKLDADVDEQPTVQKAIDQLEHFRTELLLSLFGGKAND
jgi:hypothetical protein